MSGWRRIRRGFRLLFGTVTLLLVLVLGVVAGILYSDIGARWGVRLALPFVNDLFAGDILLEDSDGHLDGVWRPKGLRIVDGDGNEAVSVGEAEIAIELPELIEQRVHISRIALTDTTFTLSDAEGGVLIAKAFEPAEPSTEPEPPPDPNAKPWLVLLDDISLRDTDFVLSVGEPPLASGIDAHLGLTVTPEGIRWSDLELSTQLALPGELPIDDAQLWSSGLLKGTRLVLDDLELRAGIADVQATGWLDDFGLGDMDLSIEEIVADLPAWMAWLGGPDLRGEARVSGRVQRHGDLVRLALGLGSLAGPIQVNASGALGLAGARALELSVAAKALAPQALFPEIPLPIQARTQLTASIRGEPQTEGLVEASAKLDQLSGLPVPIERVEILAAIRDGRPFVRAGVHGVAGERVKLSATAPDLDFQRLAADVDVRSVQVSPWLRRFGVEGIAGRLDRLSLSSRLRAPFDADIRGRADAFVRLERVRVAESVGAAVNVWRLETQARVIRRRGSLPLGNLQVALSRLNAAGVSVRDATVAIQSAPEGVGRTVKTRVGATAIDAGAVVVGGVDVSLVAQNVTLPLRQLDLSGPIEVYDLLVPGAPGEPPTVQLGSAGGQVVLHVPMDSEKPLSTEGALALVSLKAAGQRLDRVDATWNVRYGDGKPSGEVGVAANNVLVGGQRFDRVKITTSLDGVESGMFTLDARRTGTLVNTQIGLDAPQGFSGPLQANLERLLVQHGGLGIESDGRGSVVYDPGGLVGVRGIRLRRTGRKTTEVSVDGRYVTETGGVSARVRLNRIDTRSWLKTLGSVMGRRLVPVEVAGRLDADVRLDGTLDAPALDAEIDWKRGVLAGLKSLSFESITRVRPSSIRTTLDASWGRNASINLKARVPAKVSLTQGIAIKKRRPVELKARMTELDLGEVAKLAQVVGVRGRVRGAIDLEGTIAEPRGVLRLDAAPLEVPGLRRVRRARVSATMDRVRTTVEVTLGAKRWLSATVAVDAGMAALTSGRIEKNALIAPVTGRVVLASKRLSDITSAPLGGYGSVIASADLDVAGTVGDAQVTGRLEALRLPVAGQALDVALNFAQEGPNAVITADTRTDAGELANASLTLPTTLGKAAMNDPKQLLSDVATLVVIQAKSDLLAGLERWVPGLGDQLATLFGPPTVEANIEMRGGLDGARGQATVSVRGKAPSKSAVLDSVDASLTLEPQKSTVSMRLKPVHGRSILSAALEATVGTRAALNGVPKPEAIALAGAVKSTGLDTSFLSGLLPGVIDESPGRLKLDVAVTGTAAAPSADGVLDLHFDRLVLPGLGWVQPNVDLKMDLTPHRIELRDTRLVRGDGVLSLAFSADTPSYAMKDIALNGAVGMREYPVLQRDDLSATLSGDLVVSGTAAAPMITGKIIANEVLVRPRTGARDVQAIGPPPNVTFVDARGRAAAARASRKKESSIKLGLDLEIDVPSRGVHVKNDMIDVWASGKIGIQSNAGALVLVGRVVVDEGSVFVYGREFVLEAESSLFFDGGSELDPKLDIRARFSLDNVDLTTATDDTIPDDPYVLLTISGTASAPDIKFSSTPTLSQTDIISVITLGFVAGAGDDENSDKAADQIGGILLGVLASSASRMLQDRLPVDIFKVDASTGDITQAKITIGQRILRNLILSYEADLGADDHENRNELNLLYEITRWLTLETRYGDAGAGGLDLLFKWRF